jgi:hypothetical protein
MKEIDVSVIIVTFNSEDTIEDCIKAVEVTVKKHSFEIIISDNSENSETGKIVSKILDKNTVYIHNKENLGFSKGNNVAVKKANGKYILFLNPDTVVYEKTIDGMLDFMKSHSDCGASTCFVELPNGKLDDSSHRGFPTPWKAFSYFSGLSKMFQNSRMFGGYNLSYLDVKKTHEIDSLAGSFMLVPFTVGEDLGWWDEDYFFYGEDIDFCYRIKKAGYGIYFVPEFKCLHMKGISSGIKKVSKDITKATIETKKWATRHRFSAMEIFYNKHYKKKYPRVLTGMVLLGIKLKKQLALRNIK